MANTRVVRARELVAKPIQRLGHDPYPTRRHANVDNDIQIGAVARRVGLVLESVQENHLSTNQSPVIRPRFG